MMMMMVTLMMLMMMLMVMMMMILMMMVMVVARPSKQSFADTALQEETMFQGSANQHTAHATLWA